VNWIDGIPPAAAAEFAAQRRRESRRQEWTEQTKLAEMLDKYLDPADTFWTSLENKPISRLSGIFQKRRGVRSGLPDVQVIWRGKPIFIELKSRAGVASKVQKQVRLEMLLAGADWWLARSARGADGAASFGRDLPPSMEAAAVQAVGGAVRGPASAAAAGAGRGGAATSGTAAMAVAGAGARGGEVSGGARRCHGR